MMCIAQQYSVHGPFESTAALRMEPGAETLSQYPAQVRAKERVAPKKIN